MKIAIITVGDEILIGEIRDTNSIWMVAELTREGFEIVNIITVGDNEEDIAKGIDFAFSRADIVLMTGGVGPTRDDVTKRALCNYFHTGLTFDQEVLQQIERLFTKRNFTLNEPTRNQAYVPQGCTVIQNRVGTAPLLWFERENQLLVSMPGVPFEMKSAMREEIIPRLKSRFLQDEYLKSHFLVSGITESSLALQLEKFERQLPEDFSLAYLPANGLIRLRLSVRGLSRLPEMQLQTEQLKRELQERLVAESDEPVELLLGKALRGRKLTISTAESCTGGYIAHRITLVPGASEYYKGSVVSYDNRIKISMLDVSRSAIESFGAVSREVVEEMALQVAAKMESDCSIAVSGVAGPDGGTALNPVGTVWISTRLHDRQMTQRYQFGLSREENINRTTNMAIVQMMKMLG
ncbi:CinA family nicotinamide mononucleotide deamidase-related protein [Petrimonas mucosa]|uniref:CinA-like protein n=1 Tax=Petrimonas mucosa TaxID=1642646 RepID=A0A1G4G7L1_9BACT|nr:CinA family nicotinamide mononucleotide deamidase-related protein [Petrimonas mucosa]SCM58176.1 CinA-like protein {ECO:0000255/HAMAP-Rule:MF_00226} [Petrimonas mucosa]